MNRVHCWLTAALLALVPTAAHADVADGVRKWRAGDYAGAAREWAPLADAGNRDAQFNLGQAYKLGRGVPADPVKAIELYRKAAAQGHEAAEANLGWVLFQEGRREEALPLLQRAVARGDAHSQYLLGVAYFNGDIVAKDWPRAYRLMAAAATAGLPQARDALSEMDSRMPLAERQKALAAQTRPARPARRTANTAPATDSAQPQAPAPVKAEPMRMVAPPATPAPSGMAGKTASNSQAADTKPFPWRVQLGAFANRGTATAAWAKLSARHRELALLDPAYVPGGEMIRLQAGPFPDRMAARNTCARIIDKGDGCFPVQP